MQLPWLEKDINCVRFNQEPSSFPWDQVNKSRRNSVIFKGISGSTWNKSGVWATLGFSLALSPELWAKQNLASKRNVTF